MLTCNNCKRELTLCNDEVRILTYMQEKNFTITREEAQWMLTFKYWYVKYAGGKPTNQRYPFCSAECSLADYEVRNGRSVPKWLNIARK